MKGLRQSQIGAECLNFYKKLGILTGSRKKGVGDMSVDQGMVVTQAAAVRRIGLGLGQGLLLYLLFKAAEQKVWPATDLAHFQGILTPLLFAPLAALLTDALQRRARAALLTSVVLGCAAIGWFDGLRYPGPLDQATWEPGPVFAAVGAMLFIAQALVVASFETGWRAPGYRPYFNALSRRAVQLGASIAFVGALWAVLFLGAALFKLINLTFLDLLIRKAWFAIPATTMAVAVAVHVTDVRDGLVRGLRTLVQALLSWLMPVLAAMATGFMASLPFTGLQPLWDTRFAAGLLLGVAAALIILINAVYQDGSSETAPRGLFRGAMLGAMLLPAPLVAIAAHALYLRVAQYGWTSERVVALACVTVGACFGLGYLLALFGRTSRLEKTNIVASCVAVAVIFALLTPIADPVRISVASQMARLESGTVSAADFDFKYLRFEGGRYGAAALNRLAAGEIGVADAAPRAALALKLTTRFGESPIDAAGVALNVRTEAGGPLPEDFLAQDWATITKGNFLYPDCLRAQERACEAFLRDLDGDGNAEVILAAERGAHLPAVFVREQDRWTLAGTLPLRAGCEDIRTLLRTGTIKTLPARWPDLEINGLRVAIAGRAEASDGPCDPPK